MLGFEMALKTCNCNEICVVKGNQPCALNGPGDINVPYDKSHFICNPTQ